MKVLQQASLYTLVQFFVVLAVCENYFLVV